METLTKSVNGYSLETIGNTVAAIQKNPKMGDFELRVENTWLGASHNRSTIQGLYGACQEDSSRREPFVYDNDMPPVLLGENRGANPAEMLLHGLLGCMTTGIVLLAAARGIEVKGVRSKVNGDLDVKGFLGLDANSEKGFSKIQVEFEIDGVSEEEKQELRVLAMQSPVFNSLINPVDVSVKMN
jgi:uncharacterized OsmC-like protein